MASQKKEPVIGTIFSSDSSDSDSRAKTVRTSASESETNKKHVLKVNLTSGDEKIKTKKSPITPIPNDDGTIEIDKTRLGTLRHNTIIQYEKVDGKVVKSKYFKKVDHIANTIVVGFYSHDKRNYSETLSKIKRISTNAEKVGGGNQLKETILIKKDQWKDIRRDMIISYEKNDHEFVYKSRFNAFIKGSDGSTKMSLTSERGFSYVANPDKMLNIYRHVTPNDKTLTYILESIQKMDTRLKAIESKFIKK